MDNNIIREHALLSASNAERWMNCTKSARLEDTYPEEKSKFADEGTIAHALCALNLNKILNRISQKEYIEELDKIRENKCFKDEMFLYADVYTDLVMDLFNKEKRLYGDDVQIFIEKTVWYDHIAPEGFGTCDCGIMSPGGYIVIDFKYGKCVAVSAEKNPQLILYGFGFMKENGDLEGKKTLTTYICQPRSFRGPKESSDTYEPSRLTYWRNKLRKAARIAYEGGEDFVPGTWCRFCKHRNNCLYFE